MIPLESTSYIVPVSAGKTFSEIQQFSKLYKSKTDSFQIPYVVNLHRYKRISQIQSCFHFTHNNLKLLNSHKYERFKQLNFIVEHQDAVCHGFAGYFSSSLYQDIFQSKL